LQSLSPGGVLTEIMVASGFMQSDDFAKMQETVSSMPMLTSEGEL